MTIRFAAAMGRNRILRACRCRSIPLRAANDNARYMPLRPLMDQQALVVALRHFARFGLGAAAQAGLRALAAERAGDPNASL